MHSGLDLQKLMGWQKAGRHNEVLAEAFALLEALPADGDLLAMAAVSLRHVGRVDEALELHGRLGLVRPRFSLMHQERALCQLQRRAIPEAIEALIQAVEINSAMPAAWKLLQDLYLQTGETAKAAAACAQLEALKTFPNAVMIASAMVADGLQGPAEQMLRSFLQYQGEHPEALRLVARIVAARDGLDEAERLLIRALMLAPDNRMARRDFADVLIRQQKFTEAGEEVSTLLALDPNNPDFILVAAAAAIGVGQEEKAQALYRALLVERPGRADVHLWLGHTLMMTSKTPEAVTAYRRAALLRPDFGDAYWSLANLKRYRFTDEEVARMQASEAADPTRKADRYHLCFALGKGLEDRGNFAGAWRYYQQGNASKRETLPYRADITEANATRQIGLLSRSFFAERKGWGAAAGDPIFIVGLPRSGSTLIEQILASHSQVEGTQELTDVERIVFGLHGLYSDPASPRYPAILAAMEEAEFARLGARYLSGTRIHRGDAPFFIDKMPNNFQHIGLIHLMLPNARIIDVRREPMACCFSNFKQLFAQGQEFSYAIEDIGRYYRSYLDLMRHWDEALPGRVLRVHYEDVVDNLAASVERILGHCGLPFEPACLEFHKTERSIRTPSSEQVRQPICKEGLDQWRNFAPWLGPLRDALGDAVVQYRDQRSPEMTALRTASISDGLYQERKFST